MTELTLDTYTPTRRELKQRPLDFYVRPDSSDIKAIQEVVDGNGYQRPRLGFTFEPADRWLDGGANVGAFSVWAAWHNVEHITTVEPDLDHIHITDLNLTRNGYTTNLVHGALVPNDYTDNHVTLHTCDNPKKAWRHSIMWERRDSHPVQVPAHRINTVINDNNINAVKLDIEGAEIPMLCSDTFPHHQLNKLVFEWSFDVERRMSVLRGVLDTIYDQYPNVKLSKNNLPWHLPTYDFFPPQVLVYAWK